MENTTNFNLQKYQSGDYFNPLTVGNPNLDIIDATMKSNSDRAIGRATELVSQGVHAITLSDVGCKTFRFIATGNFTAGETFTVNGIQVNAYTPSGSALVSNAFVTGSVVIASLNEDGNAITVYVSGTSTSDDSLRLGGELPAYYATQADMTQAELDITNLQNQNGNTSIVGIGDGTTTGAISQLNNDISQIDTLVHHSSTPIKIGTDVDGDDIMQVIYSGSSLSNNTIINPNLKPENVKWFSQTGSFHASSTLIMPMPLLSMVGGTNHNCYLRINSTNGLYAVVANETVGDYYVIVQYVLKTD